jgi:uncharacterized protein YecT (DUF1311 family)
MCRFAIIAAIFAAFTAISHAQEPLSFEPGGKEACTLAMHERSSTSTRDLNFSCAQRDLAIEDRRLAAFTKSMESAAPDQLVAFNALMVSFSEFSSAHLDTETRLQCAQALKCGDILDAEKVRLNSSLLELLQNRVPLPEPDIATADAALNDLYQKVLASSPTTCTNAKPGCVSQASFRNTQRAWIRYRDAWITFATLRWPSVPTEVWQTYLTRQRNQQIGSRYSLNPTP